MFSGKVEGGASVVEGGRFPGAGRVALRAVRPELALMRIGLLVT